MRRLFEILAVASVWVYYGAFPATEFYRFLDTGWKLVYFAMPIVLFFGGFTLFQLIENRQLHKERLRCLAQRSKTA